MSDTGENMPPSETQQLFTVQEAAEYLGISQPTIFRWMKEGILSFYKVGGKTRFSKEGMDAVVEKTTGLKEAENAQGRCAACGNSVLIEGHMQSTGMVYFKPDKTKFWTLLESMVPIRAMVCAACGNVQMHADVKKLEKLRPADAKKKTE
jgi:excisionase family DNA binding protein